MKKFLVVSMTIALLLSLTACSSKVDDIGELIEDVMQNGSQQQEDETPDSTEQKKQTSKPDESQKSTDSQLSDEEKLLVEKADKIAVGFGNYNEQPIAWRVLTVDVQNERALLITKDCIKEVQFHAETPEDLTYRASDLRVWLTGEFHFAYFTDEEKERIIEAENPQDTNSETGAREPEGYETTDTAFILSASEMLQYFENDEDMMATLNGEAISYWTRTPGNDTKGYVCTYADGGLYMTGNQVDSTGVAVRPAIWVDISGEWDTPVTDAQSEITAPGASGSAKGSHELFDIEELAGISEFPDYAKKAIGDLRWCDDLGSDSFGKYHFNAYMKEVTQEDFETYIANLVANAPNNPMEGEDFAYYWDWGQITGTYFPDSGTLDVILTAK